MNKKMIRIAIFSIIILLIFIGVWRGYSIFKSHQKKTTTDLFCLVPHNAMAIWETENIFDVTNTIKKTSYYNQLDSLHVSDLLNYLIENTQELSDISVHGISSPQRNILISFHAPNTDKDQVLYCKLGTKDRDIIESFIKKNNKRPLLFKNFKYREEEIIIYPIKNNDFISCFYGTDFLAISYQEKLIEEVIDAFLDKTSIQSDSIFTIAHQNRQGHSESTIYLRTTLFPFESTTSKLAADSNTIWGEYDLKMNGDAIYLSGLVANTDTLYTPLGVLKNQEPIKTFPSDFLPQTTFFFQQLSITDVASVFTQLNNKRYPLTNCENHIERNDSLLFSFIEQNAESTLCNFIFNGSDEENPSVIVHIPLQDRKTAENNLRKVQQNWAKEFKNNRFLYPNYHFGKDKFYNIYEIPELLLLEKLTGSPKDGNWSYYGCFYEDNLLISPSKNGIVDYISYMDKEETKLNDLVYQECISGLATESKCIMVADLEELIKYEKYFGESLPTLFLSNREFFEHFIFALQYTHTNNNLSPTISLIYKGQNPE